jgi:hypothetical protein
MRHTSLTLFTGLLALSLTSCAASTSDNAISAVSSTVPVVAASKHDLLSPQVAARNASLNKNSVLPEMTVYKSPTCGCCTSWVEHMQKSGLKVIVVETDDLNVIKNKLGVPTELASCHTAKVGNYFVEGHVPADDVKRLLQGNSDVLGIAVPGMPMGSPGMEVPSGEVQPYTVTQVNKDASLSIFSTHNK